MHIKLFGISGVAALGALGLIACGGGGGGSAPASSSGPSTAGNTPPTLSKLSPSQSIPRDGTSDLISFEVGDAETNPAALSVSVTSSSAALLPESGIDVGGEGATRTLILHPMPQQSGNADLTVTVTDGSGAKTSQALAVDVTSQTRSFKEFLRDTMAADADAAPVETAGHAWIETGADEPAAFQSIVGSSAAE